VDSAPVLVAQQRGLFTALGLDVTVLVEPSWANIADKLTYGLLDAAVMLPPLALAAAIGLRGPAARLLVPMSLSQGGNSIVLSNDAAAAVASGGSLLGWLHASAARPRFGLVHAFSTHNLLLRYWLAASGVDPDQDIESVVVPPEDVVAALAAGRISGFCAGAPWGDVAAERGAGHVVLGTSAIWPHHPEKCLAVRADWADAEPDALVRLLRGLLQAQILCDRPEEGAAIAGLLAREDGLHLPEAASRAALAGGEGLEQIRFHMRNAWFPAQAHALWFLRQMVRWGWVGPDVALQPLAQRIYRPDLLAPALAAEDILASQALPALEEDVLLPAEELPRP
jgi:NitT/TauT family transport system ATP-binding protein/nitrate/nitrite transport system substrate-binding protein